MIRKLTILSAILAAFISSCTNIPEPPTVISNSQIDLDSILKRGKLVAVTDFSSTNYFLYKGEPMGFTYELLREFTSYLGIDLEIITENNLENAYDLLKSGDADLLAIELTVSNDRRRELSFTEPIYETRQVLVQRKPKHWRSMTEDDLNRILIRNQLDLADRTIYVQEKSIHFDRLNTLAGEIGDSIHIIAVPYPTEDLIKNVAEGEIEYTVCDENIARVNATYYSGIDVNTPVSFPQNIAWGVRRENSGQLLGELNTWIGTYRRTTGYALLYAKYFKNSRSSNMVRSDYFSLNTGKISRWDNLIKQSSADIGWDWRLLASLVYQESRFDPEAESQAGAYGLMQVMPVTGEHFGINIYSSPVNNMKAGIHYINWLKSVFESRVSDENERMKFILASYNAGPGHVLDAMKLAEKNGQSPQEWDGNVAVWLLKKSEPEYFNDTVVKNGFFKGTESVNFVEQVLERYEHYKNIVPENITLTRLAEQK